MIEITYETPTVEVVEIEVEKGFAISGSSNEQMQEVSGSWGATTTSVWDNL